MIYIPKIDDFLELLTDGEVKDFFAINFRIKNKLKGLLNDLKKFKVQTVLVLDYKKRNDSQIFHSCTKLIASYLDIDEAFKSLHQSIITKVKNYAYCLRRNYKAQY